VEDCDFLLISSLPRKGSFRHDAKNYHVKHRASFSLKTSSLCFCHRAEDQSKEHRPIPRRELPTLACLALHPCRPITDPIQDERPIHLSCPGPVRVPVFAYACCSVCTVRTSKDEQEREYTREDKNIQTDEEE